MNQLETQTNLTPIEIALGIDADGKTTSKKLYEFLELDPKNYSRWCKTNILDNEFAEENIDYKVFVIKEENPLGGRPTQDFKITSSFAKKLSMTAKNEKGEQAREYFVKTEDKLKEVAIQVSQLPPEMQMFKTIFDQQARQYMEVQQLKEESQEVNKKVNSIRNLVAINSTNWRKDTSAIINKIALKLGGFENIEAVRNESYKYLEQRLAANLNIRVTNIKKNLALNGAGKSKIDKVNQLDAIATDKRLIEGYVAIVKEMAIKYGVA